MPQFTQLLRTDRTYATYGNALKALERAIGEATIRVPYIIATTPEGRFAPVVVGAQFIPLAHMGITVVGNS